MTSAKRRGFRQASNLRPIESIDGFPLPLLPPPLQTPQLTSRQQRRLRRFLSIKLIKDYLFKLMGLGLFKTAAIQSDGNGADADTDADADAGGDGDGSK